VKLLPLTLLVAEFFCGCSRLEVEPRQVETYELQIDGKRISVELALNDPQRQKGLSHRTYLPPNQGMLFVWPRERHVTMWMKQTLIPLEVAFISADGTIVEIKPLGPPLSGAEASVTSSEPVKMALEMRRYWFKQNKVKPGQRIKLSEQLTAQIQKVQ
jgi:hypothetical protein